VSVVCVGEIEDEDCVLFCSKSICRRKFVEKSLKSENFFGNLFSEKSMENFGCVFACIFKLFIKNFITNQALLITFPK